MYEDVRELRLKLVRFKSYQGLEATKQAMIRREVKRIERLLLLGVANLAHSICKRQGFLAEA